MRVKLGMCKSADEYLDLAESKGIGMAPDLRSVAAHVSMSEEIRDVVLTKTTLRELGMPHRPGDWCTDDHIFEKFAGTALERCSPEIILALAASSAPVEENFEFSTWWFVAPRYKIRKGGIVQASDDCSYAIKYVPNAIRAWRTGARWRPEGGAISVYRPGNTIIFALR